MHSSNPHKWIQFIFIFSAILITCKSDDVIPCENDCHYLIIGTNQTAGKILQLKYSSSEEKGQLEEEEDRVYTILTSRPGSIVRTFLLSFLGIAFVVSIIYYVKIKCARIGGFMHFMMSNDFGQSQLVADTTSQMSYNQYGQSGGTNPTDGSYQGQQQMMTIILCENHPLGELSPNQIKNNYQEWDDGGPPPSYESVVQSTNKPPTN